MKETVAFVESIIESGKMDKRQALVLRGRFGFLRRVYCWPSGESRLAEYNKARLQCANFQTDLSPSLAVPLQLLRDRVLHGAPRQFTCMLLETMYFFTDASFDLQKGAGLGAVLVSGASFVISGLAYALALAKYRFSSRRAGRQPLVSSRPLRLLCP